MLACALVGWGLAAFADWAYGAALTMALAMLLGAVLRFLLPEGRAGELAVRRRPVDVLILAMLGVALVASSLSLVP